MWRLPVARSQRSTADSKLAARRRENRPSQQIEAKIMQSWIPGIVFVKKRQRILNSTFHEHPYPPCRLNSSPRARFNWAQIDTRFLESFINSFEKQIKGRGICPPGQPGCFHFYGNLLCSTESTFSKELSFLHFSHLYPADIWPRCHRSLPVPSEPSRSPCCACRNNTTRRYYIPSSKEPLRTYGDARPPSLLQDFPIDPHHPVNRQWRPRFLCLKDSFWEKIKIKAKKWCLHSRDVQIKEKHGL